jgi:hypothetical protein
MRKIVVFAHGEGLVVRLQKSKELMMLYKRHLTIK